MFQSFGLSEILLILILVVLIFGVGRISKVAKELGSSIRSFREGLKSDDEPEKKDQEKPKG
jgi:sec-independent protein translocase protein TatA